MSSSDSAAHPSGGGRLIVISGPSGAGKTSICQALLDQLSRAVWSVSVTTRPPRAGDVAGQTYEFVSPDEFERRAGACEFLEHATYVGHRYGTLRKPIEEAIASGKRVIMEIDVQGGRQVADRMPESIRVFILPPDHGSLRARLQGRGTERDDELAKRLAEAEREIASARQSGCYQHFVVNDVLETAIAEVKRIVE